MAILLSGQSFAQKVKKKSDQSIKSNQKLNKGISFKVSQLFDNANANRWITTTKEAKQFLQFGNSKQKDIAELDNIYRKKAHYIFLMGGGCFGAEAEEMQVEIKNDTLNIIWNRPKKECPPTGKVGPTYLYLELDKKQYPDYKKFIVIRSIFSYKNPKSQKKYENNLIHSILYNNPIFICSERV